MVLIVSVLLTGGNDTDTVYNTMRRLLIVLALVVVANLCLVDAFVNSNLRQQHSNVLLHQSTTSTLEEVIHPHSKLWKTTLEGNNNSSYVSGIDLVVRDPSDGGTGILAVDDIPKDTICMALNLEQVGRIDATSILDSYNEDEDRRDEVFATLKEMWNKEFAANTENTNSDEGKRLAVLAGIIAHLQLTRYKDMNDTTIEQQESESEHTSYALKESRRLGLFLDAMPLLPQHKNDKHPFPTHYLYWNDDEIQTLLQGTMGQTKAREVRAGIGLVIREWSAAFLSEHSSLTQTDILNAIFSAFTAVLSRSFGDEAGRDVDGKGRMLVPLVDMLNHDSEEPNVKWQWLVGEGDDELIAEGNGEIIVTTLRDIKKGEELLKCYGWRPAWDIASSYGFVPRLKKQRWECAVIPLFPSVLDLSPDSLPTPNNMDDDKVDLLLETNYGPLVQAILAAVNAANEIKARQKQSNTEGIEDDDQSGDRPYQLDRLEVVSLFVPALEQSDYPFPLRRPCVVVGTKVHVSSSDTSNDHHHHTAIESILPAFRAAASAISQLRDNHQKSDASPIEASQMAIAAASIDKDVDWDTPALKLINEGIEDRIQTLVTDEKAADTWLVKQNDASGMSDQVVKEHRQLRADMAKDVRYSELMVLQTLQKTATRMLYDSRN